jgi:NADPH-dependent glutamate synthase beta subunit-like oxidoreductase
LKRALDLLAICTGASIPRRLSIPGSDGDNCITSDKFIGWVNGHPATKDLNFDLSRIKTIGIIGNGNVALDVARLFLKNPNEFSSTDISSRALNALMNCRAEKVMLFGRRGAINVPSIFRVS